jgi:hypothetical protein
MTNPAVITHTDVSFSYGNNQLGSLSFLYHSSWQENILASTSLEHYPTYKYFMGNTNHAQDNRVNQTSFQLYLYSYHPPLDVNLTHWDSRSAPTLPLPPSRSTFSQSFYISFSNNV